MRKETLKEKRAYFEDKWNYGGGFYKKLCETLLEADKNNIIKLYQGFPKLVEGYVAYSYGKEYSEWVSSK